MQAIIPAGGWGTRMMPFSAVTAKELAPIGTKPAIQYTLEEAAANGISSVIVVSNRAKTALTDFLTGKFPREFRNKPGVKQWLEFRDKMEISVTYQEGMNGLGDAFLCGYQISSEDEFYLMYPDNVLMDGKNQFEKLKKPFMETGFTTVATQADQPFWSGNHYLYLGEELAGAHHLDHASSRNDPAPEKGRLHFRAAGRVLCTKEYFETLKAIQEQGVEGELDDIHAYRVLAEKRRLLAIQPASVIYDSGCIDGYRDLWAAYLAGDFKSPLEV
jgi:UTP--glucose-1-phosphate uridylyltransferase